MALIFDANDTEVADFAGFAPAPHGDKWLGFYASEALVLADPIAGTVTGFPAALFDETEEFSGALFAREEEAGRIIVNGGSFYTATGARSTIVPRSMRSSEDTTASVLRGAHPIAVVGVSAIELTSGGEFVGPFKVGS